MIADDLNWVQTILQDTPTPGDDGSLWTRAELLDAYNAGYRHLLTQSQAVRRFTALDIPGRFTWAITHDWEARYTQGGTFWQWSWAAQNGRYAASALWEIPVIEDTDNVRTSEGITQQWERQFVSPSQQYYRFALPRDHDRIVALWYNHERLVPVALRALDGQEQHWMSLGGEPLGWTQGVGRNRTCEVYEIVTSDQQAYALPGCETGFARLFSGARTYTSVTSDLTQVAYAYTGTNEGAWVSLQGFGVRLTTDAFSGSIGLFEWELQWLRGETLTAGTRVCTQPWETAFGGVFPALPLGQVRHLSSPQRQYLAYPGAGLDTLWGIARTWHSSTGNLLLLEVVGPEIPSLTEDDTPALLPVPLQKYLRYYVLARAWSRQGEGAHAALALYAEQRYGQGVHMAQTLSNLSRYDQQQARGHVPVTLGHRPARPRLPSSYPAVRR